MLVLWLVHLGLTSGLKMLNTKRPAILGLGRRERPYLYLFGSPAYQKDVDKMKECLRKVEKELKIQKTPYYDINRNPKAFKVWALLDRTAQGKLVCGFLPFCYNTKTGAVICGKSDYYNVLSWARGGASYRWYPPVSEEFSELSPGDKEEQSPLSEWRETGYQEREDRYKQQQRIAGWKEIKKEMAARGMDVPDTVDPPDEGVKVVFKNKN